MPLQGLVAQLIGPSGKAEEGVSIDFQSPTDGSYGWYSPQVALSPDGAYYQAAVSATTDAQGRAVVRLRFGLVAGPAKVTAITPLYGLADTASFTVNPGAAVAVQAQPRDTAIEVQGSFHVTGSTVDRAGNARSDPATYEAASGVVRVDASGAVTGVTIGRTFVRVKAAVANQARTDSCGVSVVPTGRIVYETASRNAMRISNLTGTSPRTVLAYAAGAGAWSPAGDRIAFCSDVSGQGIGVTDTLGNATMLASAADGCWPQFSPDGQWIYYHGSGQIRRIHPDGTGVDTLFPGSFPTAAPDGYRVAFQLLGTLTIGDVRTRTATALAGVSDVFTPRWSPDGQMIAYVGTYRQAVRVVRPDGSRVRDFAGYYDTGLGWSPDSRFILASTGYQLVLLDVTTGSSLPLRVPGVYPNWAP